MCTFVSLQDYGCVFTFFFFNDTATTEIYTLSLHDALPIYSNLAAESRGRAGRASHRRVAIAGIHRLRTSHRSAPGVAETDRKSTRLNSSHANISYAVFCLKKKKKILPSNP